jgi:hypothetical protein
MARVVTAARVRFLHVLCCGRRPADATRREIVPGCDLTKSRGLRFPLMLQHDGHSLLVVGTCDWGPSSGRRSHEYPYLT